MFKIKIDIVKSQSFDRGVKMLFIFSLFLPLVFIPTLLFFKKSKELFMLALMSYIVLGANALVVLANHFTPFLQTDSDYSLSKYFNHFTSPTDIILYICVILLMAVSLFSFGYDNNGEFKKSCVVNSFFSLFLVTVSLFTKNLFVAFLSLETFIWVQIFFVLEKENIFRSRSFAAIAALSTFSFLIFVTFIGLLSQSVLGESTYNFKEIQSFTISYVSGTLYSTQTSLFLICFVSFLMKLSLIKSLTLSLLSSLNITKYHAMVGMIGVVASLIIYMQPHHSLFSYIYRDWSYYIYLLTSLAVVYLIFDLGYKLYKSEEFTWKN